MKEEVARRRSEIAARFAQRLRGLIIGALCAARFSCVMLAAEQRPFTIKDSIELSYFVRPVLWTVNQEPPTAPIVSPDGRRFILITQRGILSTNKIESSIWMLDRQSVGHFIETRSPKTLSPTRLAIFEAATNTPVISDVRWLDDSRRVAFLAKANDEITQLYVVDSITGVVSQLTRAEHPVSAYDIRGKTVAYTTFDAVAEPSDQSDDLLDVTGKSIWSFLWRNRRFKDLDEPWLLAVPNTLHVVQEGKELKVPFRFESRQLKLFFPTLSLSPDGKSLITVAPVTNVPPNWKSYQARFGYEDLVMIAGNKSSAEPENNWKASQFIRIDLATGIGSPLINAPAGRSVFQVFAPTKAIWSLDSRTVLLSNTFLPLTGLTGDTQRRASPAIVTVNLSNHDIDVIRYMPQPARGSSPSQHVADVVWKIDAVELLYASSPDNVFTQFRETYQWTGSGWKATGGAHSYNEQMTLTVYQSLNRAPVLIGSTPDMRNPVTLWDPNPQLANVDMGQALLYQWHDATGAARSGILVLPTHYSPGHRYPLVIQTHGFEPKKFFADGIYTTGSGGRALSGRGIIVLQTDQYSKSDDYRHDAEVQVEAFRSAIQQLTENGLIDSKRVGIIGFSFTVYHALYAITHYPDLFAAASVTDGNDLSYWLYLLWTDIPVAQQMAEAANGGVKPFGKQGLSKWEDSAPGFNLDNVQTPLLINCLEKGTLVATWDIYAGLRTLNKPVEMLWLKSEDAPHVLVQPHHRYLSQENAVDWFDFWLNAHEDPVPDKAMKYARWRELRKLGKNGLE